jgi:hypothetical protein
VEVTATDGRKRTRRAPEEIVRALLDKTVERGATAGEERAAVTKAERLISKHGPDRSQFEFPPDRMLAKGSKRRTIREALGYEEILSRVRAEFAGCKSSVKCLRYYATKMRGRDVRVPTRPRKPVAVR